MHSGWASWPVAYQLSYDNIHLLQIPFFQFKIELKFPRDAWRRAAGKPGLKCAHSYTAWRLSRGTFFWVSSTSSPFKPYFLLQRRGCEASANGEAGGRRTRAKLSRKNSDQRENVPEWELNTSSPYSLTFRTRINIQDLTLVKLTRQRHNWKFYRLPNITLTKTDCGWRRYLRCVQKVMSWTEVKATLAKQLFQRSHIVPHFLLFIFQPRLQRSSVWRFIIQRLWKSLFSSLFTASCKKHWLERSIACVTNLGESSHRYQHLMWHHKGLICIT